MKSLILTAILLIANTSWARGGDEVGNGGNFMICPHQQGQSNYELLDFYEARVVYGYNLLKPNSNLNWKEQVTQTIAQLENISPMRAGLYTALLKEISDGALFLSGGAFTSSEDVGPVLLPENCRIQQVATQFIHPVSSHRAFYINSDVWNQLDDSQKAGLVLHEIILAEGVESGHKTSKRTRHLNALLHSEQSKHLTVDSFLSFVRTQMGFRYEDRSYYWLELFDDQLQPRANEWYSNGNPRYVYTRPDTLMCWGREHTCWSTKRSLDVYPDLSFYENGNLKAGYTDDGAVTLNNQVVKFHHIFQFHENTSIEQLTLQPGSTWIFKRFSEQLKLDGLIRFYPSGEVQHFGFNRVFQMPIAANQSAVAVGSERSNLGIELYPNSNIRSACFDPGVPLHSRSGTFKSQASCYEFDEDGFVIK